MYVPSLETRLWGREKVAWGVLLTHVIVTIITKELSSIGSLKIELAGAVVHSTIKYRVCIEPIKLFSTRESISVLYVRVPSVQQAQVRFTTSFKSRVNRSDKARCLTNIQTFLLSFKLI